MRAVLLAAGKGERLGSITHKTPKPMIPFKGKPLLEWNINLCKRYEITDIFINLHHLPNIIKNYFGNGKRLGVTITYIYEPELLGTAGGVKQFSKALQGSAFFVIYSDNWSDYNLKAISDFHQESGAEMTIALFHLEDIRHSGIAVLDHENKVLEFIEKPRTDSPPSHLVNAGIYLIEPQLLSQIPNGTCDFGKDVIPNWIKAGVNVRGIKMEKKVTAIDTPDLLNKVKI